MQKDYTLSEVEALIQAHLEGPDRVLALQAHRTIVGHAERAEALADHAERAKDDARRIRDYWVSRWPMRATAIGCLGIALGFVSMAYIPDVWGETVSYARALGIIFAAVFVVNGVSSVVIPCQHRKAIRKTLSKERLLFAINQLALKDPGLGGKLIRDLVLNGNGA